LQAFDHPVGAYMADDSNAHTLRGQAWHACLEHLTPLGWQAFDEWWCGLQTLCADVLSEVDEEALSQIQLSLRDLLSNPALRVWLDDAQVDEVHNEMEWMDAQGHLHRADRLVRKGRQWWVIDYKWSWSEDVLPSYVAQLNRYAQAVAATFHTDMPVRRLLLNAVGDIYEPADGPLA